MYWNIACRRCSNWIFILNLPSGFNGLGKDNCKTRLEPFWFWNLVQLYIRSLTVSKISFKSPRSPANFKLCYPTFRIFLYELGGNPNKKNARNETALHSVCLTSVSCRTYALQQRRLECLMLILQWRGPKLANGEYERVQLDTCDEVSMVL